MRKYDSYKDSGVEWIGEIPSGWEINRLKWITLIENSGIWGEDEEFPNSINVPIPTTGQLSIEGEWYYDKMNLRHLSMEDWEKYKCIVGDIVVVKSSGSSTNIITGKCGFISKEDSGKFGFSNFLLRVRPNKIKPKLVYYFLSSNLTKQRIERMVSSTTYPNLKVDEYSNSELLIPPLSEQQQIVSYLDRKTSQIDSLIEKTQRKIELLKEKRTSLINEVVTKGLNPNVEMKDSSVEWIGEIPNHYQFGKLKHLCKENQRSLPNSTDPNYELNYIEISDVNSEGVIGNPTPYIFSESPSRCRRIVQKGDVIVSTVRTYLKSIGLIEEEVEDLICSTGFSVLTPNNEINSKYLFYLLRTEWFISMVISKSEGVSYPSIQSEKLMNIDVVYCELSEQQQIVSYLDEHTQLIDKTISIEEKRIELLKEYRQSLISEVVTGKRKVIFNE